MNYASIFSGFQIMGKIEMAGAMFSPIFVLTLPVAKAKVPKQNAMLARLCHTRLVPVGHKKQVEKPDTRCVIGVFHLLNPIKWCKQT